MARRLKEQLTDGIQWAKEQAKNNPLGALVVIVFAIWFIVSLGLTEWTDRWGFATKTFWDWLDLLIVPLVLALGAFWFNASQKRTEVEIANNRQQQATLEAYYDRMADLLLNYGLRETVDKDEEPSIARARTLTVLRSLDADRKRQALVFLYESGLISKENTVVNLSGANLSGANLFGVYLCGANLSGVDLNGANLMATNLKGANLNDAVLFRAYLNGANLNGANLNGANLNGAELFAANLSGANLGEAYLSETNLGEANLIGTNLSEAYLSGAKGWTPEQLQQAKSLENATMPDGIKYEEWIEKHKDQPE